MTLDAEAALSQIIVLTKEIKRHRKLYYVDAKPEISDREYDSLEKQLARLEEAYPEYDFPDSPSHTVGSSNPEDYE